MAYDATDGQILLFGEENNTAAGFTILGDTWRFQSGSWTQLFPSISPSPRSSSSMAFDGTDGYVLLFGGEDVIAGTSFLGDTWKFGPITPVGAHSTATDISCDAAIVVNQASTCAATVKDTSASGATSPSGAVTFSTTLSVPGSFDSTTCNLVAGATGTATCSVHFNPLRYDLGPVSVSASYGGDSTHNGSSSSVFNISVNGRAAVTTLACDTPVSLPSSSLCTVTVTDTETVGTPLTPSGDVQPLTTNSTGTFGNSGFCGLTGSGASSSCAFSYTPTVVGGHNVTAYHLSDGQHLPSSASFVITFNPSALQSTSTSLICDTP